MTFRRSLSLLLACVSLLIAAPHAGAEPRGVLPELAHDIRTDSSSLARWRSASLSPLGAMVADASVVGFGEASHGAAEFPVTKHRAFRYLVQDKGFRTFSLEVSWSAGLRLNEYVLAGRGDPRRIMSEEFQANYQIWHTGEYLDLIEWMRAYNVRHADKVQFAGHDMVYSGPEQFDLVTRYVAEHRPDLLDQVTARYAGLRPTVDVGTWLTGYRTRLLAERQAAAALANEALDLVAGLADPSAEHAWTVRHATVIAQTFRMWAADFTDPLQATEAFRYRELATAENLLWWQRHTGDRILLSAANFHVAHESYTPGYPRVQGTYLREALGDRYISVGFTFGRGRVNARESDGDPLLAVRVAPAPPGNNEHLLEQMSPYGVFIGSVAERQFLLDTRTLPAAARDWLAQPRPTRSFGEFYPVPDAMVALGRSYDLIIHLHRVRPTRLLP